MTRKYAVISTYPAAAAADDDDYDDAIRDVIRCRRLT